MQRLTARISTGRASPRNLAAVNRTLALLPSLKAQMRDRESALLRDLEARLEVCPELREALESALVDDPPLSPREGGVIRRDYDKELDEQRDITTQGKDWMAQFQAEQVRRTGITSLKVSFNQVFGYYIEITHANAGRVPTDYKRVSTLKNAERYTTPELKEWEEKVLGGAGQNPRARIRSVPPTARAGGGADESADADGGSAGRARRVGVAGGVGRRTQLRAAGAGRRADAGDRGGTASGSRSERCRRGRSCPTA